MATSTKAIAKVYARQIKKGKKTIDEVPENIREEVREAHFELFGEEI